MQNKILQVHRGIWLAGDSWLLHQWLVSRGIWKLASSHSARVGYRQRWGTAFGRGSSCRNSVTVPQLNTFTSQRQKTAGGIAMLTAQFKNSAITSSQILESGFSLALVYSKPSQAVMSSLKTVSDFEALVEIYLWDKYIFPLNSTETRFVYYFLSLIPYFRQLEAWLMLPLTPIRWGHYCCLYAEDPPKVRGCVAFPLLSLFPLWTCSPFLEQESL